MWWIMKGNNPSLFGALLLSLLVRILLRARTLFPAREGLLMLLPGIGISALGGLVFAWAWSKSGGPVLRLLLGALLAWTAATQTISLWQLYRAVYPDAVSLIGICLTVMLPVLYLRRVSSIAQTANVALGLLLAAGVLLILSLAGRLQVTHLQITRAESGELWQALLAQCRLSPELLVPAVLAKEQKDWVAVRRTIVRLAALGGSFLIGVHVVVELFFGFAAPQALNPVHQAARCGNLSIFDRLEWLQLIVWTMAVSVQLGLTLYAVLCLAGCRQTDTGVPHGLPQFCLAVAVLVLLCALLQNRDPTRDAEIQNLAGWCLAALASFTGGVGCLTRWYANLRR